MSETPELRTLLMTDMVDSTQVNEQLGDAAMAQFWASHDKMGRDLIRASGGREVGRSDGFLVLFEDPDGALALALAYHRGLAKLQTQLKARVGVHQGLVTLRENLGEDVALGATPFEVDGVALPIAARVMSAALPGQTLITGSVRQALGSAPVRTRSHGYWRLKGLSDPIELFEAGGDEALFVPPVESPKAYRVVRHGEGWRTQRSLPNNLPAERDTFVGRQSTLQVLSRALDDGGRLVTLLGTGGIGKTRLALTYARSWLGDFPGGAYFCDLSAARSLDGVVHAVAQTLDVPLRKGDPVRELGAAIAGLGQCLLILDNFEQVSKCADATLGAWLERAPESRFIATSREVLGIGGEHALVLAPLSAEEAAQVFRTRVKAAGVSSAFTDEDERACPRLMDLLDRLPLAIELAAARVRVMGPRMLLDRMGERFKVLTARSGRRDRQATLRATLDWSWDLLTPDERSALAQLSAFEGGFNVEAVEAIVALAPPGDRFWAPDVIQALVEKSLVRSNGGRRFDMLRSIHDYALERLDASGMAKATQIRHWRYFASIDESQATTERGVELDNFILACRRSVVADPPSAVMLLQNCWAILRLTGPFDTAVKLAEAVESALPIGSPELAIVNRIIGAALSLQGNLTEARSRCLFALEISTGFDDTVSLARSKCLLAELELTRGEVDVAARLLQEVQESPVAMSNSLVRYTCLNGLGKVNMGRSMWSASRACYAQALSIAEALDNRRWQGGLQGSLGLVARAEGRLEDARNHWRAALLLASEVGDRQWAGNTHCNLGLLLHELGYHVEASKELQIAMDIARAIGHRKLEATALCNLGLVEEARRDHLEASNHHTRAAQIAQSLGDKLLEGQARGYLGLSLAGLGRHDAATSELTEALQLLQAHGDLSALALVLLQMAAACAAREDAPSATKNIASAQSLLATMVDSVAPEVVEMLSRAQQALDELIAAPISKEKAP
jgi:predicted ATPase/class 3 adenylate cyclase